MRGAGTIHHREIKIHAVDAKAAEQACEIQTVKGAAEMSTVKTPMTRQRLKQYVINKKDVDGREYARLRSEKVTDAVRGSSKEAPYLQHTIVITGIDDGERAKLDRKRRAVEREEQRIVEFIDGLSDNLIKQILRLRYLEGMTYDKVAKKLYGKDNGDAVRMSINRFFDSRE